MHHGASRVESSRFSLLKLAQQATTRSKQSLERASLIMHVPMASQPASHCLLVHACMHACMGTKWKYNMWSESVGLTQRLTGRQAVGWNWPTTRSNMRRTHRHLCFKPAITAAAATISNKNISTHISRRTCSHAKQQSQEASNNNY